MHNQTLKLSSSNLCISIFSSEVSNESSSCRTWIYCYCRWYLLL